MGKIVSFGENTVKIHDEYALNKRVL